MIRHLSSVTSSARKAPAGNRRRTNPRQRQQQHLLDVTVRSRKASQRRNRYATKIFFSLVVVAGLVGGAWWGGQQLLRKFLWDNADYRLTAIEALTDGELPRETILETADIREGENIFSVSLSKARERLQALPQVAAVEMTRTLPNRIMIKIAERRPVAWVVEGEMVDPLTSAHAFVVDEKGIVFQHHERSPVRLHLPLIYGADLDELRPGEPVRAAALVAALNLVRLQMDEPRFLAQRIDVSKGYCLVATDRNGSSIVFGLENLKFQLDRLGQIFNHLDDSRQEIRSVNLMVERNVPVTFNDPTAGAETPEATEPAPPAAAEPGEPMVRKAIPIE